jgi:hypothetical protein
MIYWKTMPTILAVKGNFYLFFVILSSSLEAPTFHLRPIRYLNSVVQVLPLHHWQNPTLSKSMH